MKLQPARYDTERRWKAMQKGKETPRHDPWLIQEDQDSAEPDPNIPDILSRLEERMPVTEAERRMLEQHEQHLPQDEEPDEEDWSIPEHDPYLEIISSLEMQN